jgi:hypothetical protein
MKPKEDEFMRLTKLSGEPDGIFDQKRLVLPNPSEARDSGTA